MRSGLDAPTLALYGSQRYDSHVRIKVANGSGTLVNLQGRFKAFNLQMPNPNLPIGALTVEFVRETDLVSSLAPFVTVSTYNRLNDGTTFSPLLQLGRLVTMDVALTAVGGARPADGASTWYEVFRGTIANVKWPQRYGRTATILCTDVGGLLQKSKSEAAYVYTAGTSIETVAQQILTNNGHAWVTFSCPVATGKVLPNDYAPGVQKTVWEQLWSLAQSMGWLIWFRYSGTSTLTLTLFEPPRGKTISDQAFDFIHEFTDFGIDENEIGNVIRVRYFDVAGVQQEVGPFEDAASIAYYGGTSGIRRPMWITLNADSPVRDATAATALGNAALADVADPDVLATVTLPPMWFAEAAIDLYTFPPLDGRIFDVSQQAAPFTVTTIGRGDQPIESTMDLRGKPSIGNKAWGIVGGGTIITSGTGSGLNSIYLPDVLDSFVLGDLVPYNAAGGGPTTNFPQRVFTVHSTAALDTWSLGGLFIQDIGNVAAFGPQGLENYLRFQNTNTLAGPNIGIISNAELAGDGGVLSGLALFTGGLVINSNGSNVALLADYDAGGVNRVSGKTGTVTKMIGFNGGIPATSAAVTGTSWNAYMYGTAPNFFAGRVYFGSDSGSAYIEGSGGTNLWSAATLSVAALAISGTTVITSGSVLQNVTANASILSTGTLAYGRLPTLSGTWDTAGGTITLNGPISSSAGITTTNAFTGLGLILTAGGTSAAGRITRSATLGVVIQGSAGSSRCIDFLNDAGNSVLSVLPGSTELRSDSSHFVGGSLRLGNAGLGGGVGVFGLLDATTAPTSTPAGGSVVWSTGGVLKTRSAMDALGGYYVNGAQVVTPTGTLAPGSVANAAAFAASLKPIEVWTYATLPVSPAANTIVFVTDWPLGGGPTGPRMARWSGSAWIALAAADQIVGQLTAGSIAAGAVTASAINVSALSAISANVGTVNAGVLQNASGTRYMDLSAGTANFIQHERLSLKHDGSALFTGVVKLDVSTGNTVEFWNSGTNVSNISTEHYTFGSGYDAVNFEFPSISRSWAIYAQSGNLWVQNVDSSGTANSTLVMGADTVLLGTTSLSLAGTGTNLGFFGATPVSKRTVTGSKASGAALASLLLALVNYGFITDNTTA